jgi:SAM-dependent methyltransferase
VCGIDVRASDDPAVVVANLSVAPIPFDDRSFDVVTAFDFIEHVPRIDLSRDGRFPFVELMNEVHRVLKPGGLFYARTPAYPHADAFQDPTHVNIITEATFRSYFCFHDYGDPWARMYGFAGNFEMVSQGWAGSWLMTLMRKVE